MAKTVRVNKEDWTFYNGYAPRGFGLWCFEISGPNGESVTLTPERAMLFGEAVRLAKRQAKRIGADTVWVLA